MKSSGHYFLGIPLSSGASDCLNNWSSELSKHLKYGHWTASSDLHVTLKFLGAATEEQLLSLQSMLNEVSQKYRPIQTAVEELEWFGNPSRPRVIWAGIHEDSHIHFLQQDIEAVCASVGFEKERRQYRPHITIAKKWRGHSPIEMAVIKNQLNLCTDTQRKWTIDRFNIYKVNPNRTPRYEAIETYMLEG